MDVNTLKLVAAVFNVTSSSFKIQCARAQSQKNRNCTTVQILTDLTVSVHNCAG